MCEDGSAVYNRRRIGQGNRLVEAEIEFSDEMMPGVISLPHGWGHDQAGSQMDVAAANPGANINQLMDEDRRDPLSGNAVLSGVEVQMEPVGRPLAYAGQTR